MPGFFFMARLAVLVYRLDIYSGRFLDWHNFHPPESVRSKLIESPRLNQRSWGAAIGAIARGALRCVSKGVVSKNQRAFDLRGTKGLLRGGRDFSPSALLLNV